MNLRSLSLSRQLMLVTVMTSIFSLLVVVFGFFFYDASEFRTQMVRDLTTTAEIVGFNSTVPLSFKEMGTSKEEVKKTLVSLKLKNEINAAVIYSSDGQLFAQYQRDPSIQIPAAPGPDGARFEGNVLRVTRKIFLNDTEFVGTIYLEASMASLYQRQQQYGLVAAALLFLASLLSYLLVTRTVGTLTAPLQALVEITRRIAKNNDYSLQVDIRASGELQDLINSFNRMMAEVQQRDNALKSVNENLEQRVIERTTALKTQEAERQRAELAAEAAESANRVKSAFLANMSHELRTPLNAIIGYSEILEEEAVENEDDTYVPDLQKISTAGKHLLSLINDILDLSKIEAGKMDIFIEQYEVMTLIREVTDTINPLMGKKKNTLRVECGSHLGIMNSDLTKMRQSLFNLLSNASKFTEEGTVTLSVHRIKKPEGDTIVFRVQDTGIGMTPEQMSRLFQAFSQADASTTRKYGGTGLGLTITRRFCQMLGGDITVESELGRGSAFTIIVPCDLKATAQTTTEAPIEPAGDEDGPLILVIDDEPAARELLTRYLTKEGYRVETASSGKEGLERARTTRPILITLDVIMPQMNGWAVLAALKSDAELADIPVVMVTMVDERSVGYAMGAANYLTKPIDKNRLIAAVSRYRSKTDINSVLILEDDAPTRQVASHLLEKDGWIVQEAENGQAGLEMMSRQTPRLILLDLMMPVMDGFAFVEEISKHEKWAQIPIIVLTAMDLSEEDRLRLDGRVQQVVQKSAFRLEELPKKLASLRQTPADMP